MGDKKPTGGIYLEEGQNPINDTADTSQRKPSPSRSAIYSLVFPGLGQLNNGDTSRGLLFFAIAFILILSAHLGVTLIILVLFWLYNIYDAYSGAKKLS